MAVQASRAAVSPAWVDGTVSLTYIGQTQATPPTATPRHRRNPHMIQKLSMIASKAANTEHVRPQSDSAVGWFGNVE